MNILSKNLSIFVFVLFERRLRKTMHKKFNCLLQSVLIVLQEHSIQHDQSM